MPVAVAAILLSVTGLISTGGGFIHASAPDCTVPPMPRVLTLEEVPEGVSVVDCGVVGREVTNGHLTLTIPSPGHGVWQDNDYPDGAKSFAVVVGSDGSVEYPETAEAPGSLLGASACSQNGYNLEDAVMDETWEWWLGDGVRPAGLTTDQTEAAVRDFLNNVTLAFNDCGLADNISVTLEYNGVTAHESDFHVEDGQSRCGDGSIVNPTDDTDTIDFGNLDDNGSPPLAATCKWTFPAPGSPNNILEADVRFNTTDYSWTNTGGSSSCQGKFDLRHVGTHEAGHVFGLKHVSATTDSVLTMRKGSTPCTIWKRTLGLGDVRGLEQRY